MFSRCTRSAFVKDAFLGDSAAISDLTSTKISLSEVFHRGPIYRATFLRIITGISENWITAYANYPGAKDLLKGIG